MSSFRSRARRLAFNNSIEDVSDASSTKSSTHSTSSFSLKQGFMRQSSSISEQCSCHNHEKKPIRVQPRRTNRVRKIHRSQPFEQFVEALETDGCVIIQDFVNPQISQRVQQAEESSFSDQIDQGQQHLKPVDVNSLIRESLVSDQLFQTLSSHFLTLETISWQNKEISLNSSRPRISRSTTRDLNSPSLDPLLFHRADSAHHTRHHATSKYEYQSRRETSVGLFVPELDSLSASIAVQTIPGSHLWDDSKPHVTQGVREVTLKAGDALILLGSLYHRVDDGDVDTPKPALSRNSSSTLTSGTIKEKLVHEVWMCSGVYRSVDELEKDEEEEEY